MSMRISVDSTNTKNKPNTLKMPQISDTYWIDRNNLNNETTSLYVKQVPRRTKSPFRKYERAAIEASKSPIITKATNYNNKPKKDKLPEISASTPSVLITRKETINSNEMKQKNNYRQVNNFEDLVIACVDSSTISEENNFIFYKNKYLLNLTGRNTNLKRGNESDIKNISNENINLLERPKAQPVKVEQILCSKCKTALNDDEINEFRSKIVHFKNEEEYLTAAEIERLKAEDFLLRKKIAEGDCDPLTFKRLEHICKILIKNNQTHKIISSAQRRTTQQLKSLGDQSFTNELKQHPIIRKKNLSTK